MGRWQRGTAPNGMMRSWATEQTGASRLLGADGGVGIGEQVETSKQAGSNGQVAGGDRTRQQQRWHVGTARRAEATGRRGPGSPHPLAGMLSLSGHLSAKAIWTCGLSPSPLSCHAPARGLSPVPSSAPQSCWVPADLLVQGSRCSPAPSHPHCCVVAGPALPLILQSWQAGAGPGAIPIAAGGLGASWSTAESALPRGGGRARVARGAWPPHPSATPRALPPCQTSVPTTEEGCLWQLPLGLGQMSRSPCRGDPGAAGHPHPQHPHPHHHCPQRRRQRLQRQQHQQRQQQCHQGECPLGQCLGAPGRGAGSSGPGRCGGAGSPVQ